MTKVSVQNKNKERKYQHCVRKEKRKNHHCAPLGLNHLDRWVVQQILVGTVVFVGPYTGDGKARNSLTFYISHQQYRLADKNLKRIIPTR